MSYEVAIVADSIGPNKARITTFQLRFPRLILPQFNTHRAISKNARSSRAVPVEKMIDEVMRDGVLPVHWGKNQRGMAATRDLDRNDISMANAIWLDTRDVVVAQVKKLVKLGVHKQIANRMLEPFMWIDVVATATDWSNFFALRCDKHAQPEFQKLAVMMARALRDSEPWQLEEGWWHLPYIMPEDQAGILEDPELEANAIRCSVARCARVSYAAFDGRPVPLAKDIEFHDTLVVDGHWSPTEHQGRAQPAEDCDESGNFLGFDQYRQTLKKSVHTSFDYASLDVFGEQGYVLEEVPA